MDTSVTRSIRFLFLHVSEMPSKPINSCTNGIKPPNLWKLTVKQTPNTSPTLSASHSSYASFFTATAAAGLAGVIV